MRDSTDELLLQRIATAETAVLNEIRDLSARLRGFAGRS